MSYRVLEVNVDDRGRSGVYSLVTNVIKNKNENINIDIAAFEYFENKDNILELKQYGTHVENVGYHGCKLIKQYIIYRNLLKYLKKNKYDCVHIHSDVANKLFIGGLAAKKAGVKKIIFHSHASEVDGKYRNIKRFLHKVSRKRLKKIGTKFVACSDLARQWMYPNINKDKVIIIKNGIDLVKYRFNEKSRLEVRKKLGLNNKFVIGHVGRFSYQKNHEFLIKVFKKVVNKKGNAYLLLVGEGPDKKKIENLVNKEGLTAHVKFYGISNHVENLLQGMDVFLLPSHFEGLPIVGVEAQAAGLPVIFSDKITKEAKLLDTSYFLSINNDMVSEWVNLILRLQKSKRKDTINILHKEKFDISDTVSEFISLYS